MYIHLSVLHLYLQAITSATVSQQKNVLRKCPSLIALFIYKGKNYIYLCEKKMFVLKNRFKPVVTALYLELTTFDDG